MRSMTRTTSAQLASLLVLATACGGSSKNNPGTPTTPLKDAAAAQSFYIGAAIAPQPLGISGTAVPSYVQTTQQQFNIVTFENQLKWASVHPSAGTSSSAYSFSVPDQMLAFAQQNGMVVRGHTLLWWSYNPSWMGSYSADSSGWQTLLQNHITTVMTHYKGKIRDWDVVNEPFDSDGSLRGSKGQGTVTGNQATVVDWYNKAGSDYITKAFQWAREADPSARLFLNEYGIELPGAKADGFYNYVKDMKANGVPIDGVGFQFHFGGVNWDGSLAAEPNYAAIESNIQRFIALGLEVQVTEADYRLSSSASTFLLTQQANFFSQLVAILLRNGQNTFVVWGVDDSHSWMGASAQALLFDANDQPKPAVEAILSALGQ
jgi:endo-1,4-beta-xylanase